METQTNPARIPLLALGAGGILIVVGHALTVPMADGAHDYVARFATSRVEHVGGLLLTIVGVLMLVPGLGGVLRVLDGSSRLARIGCALAGIGAAALAVGSGVIAFTMGTLAGENTALAEHTYTAMDHSTLGTAPFMLAPLFVVGLVLVGIALSRIGRSTRVPGLLLAVGAVLVMPSGSGGVSAALLLVPLAVALAAVARTLWRRPLTALSQKAAIAPAT